MHIEPASGDTASEGRVNDAWASTLLTRLESSSLPAGTTVAKPPGVFLEPPPGVWSNVSRSQGVAEPALKQARTANDEDQLFKGAQTGEPKMGGTGAPSFVECMKSAIALETAGQASGLLGKILERQGPGAGPALANDTIRKPPIALEICCGHAGLALACCKVCFVAKGTDW